MSRSRKRKLARRRAKHPRAQWMGLSLASLLAGNAVHAADADATADTANTAGTLEEVVVTAQKRSEDLQKVPISLQVLSSQTLEEHQVTSFDDYAKLLTSVSYQSLGPGQAQIYFRGIASGADGLHAGSLPATGVYLDEIPVTTIGNTLDIHMYDIQRVEALAGPQGTLYGASSLSGTLRIITNKPDPTKFEAGYDLKGDKYGHGGDGGGEFDGFVNIPLSEHIAVRLVGYYEHDGGYLNNVLYQTTLDRGSPPNGIPNDPATYTDFQERNDNDVTTFGGRGALKFDLNDQWTITPQVLWQSQRANGNFTYNPALGNGNIGDFFKGVNEDKWYQSALAVEGKVANFDIVYSGGWFERDVHNLVDYTGYTIAYDHLQQIPGETYGTYDHFYNPATGQLTNPLQYNDNHDKYTKMSHEFRVTSPSDFRLRATAGLFYQRQTDDIRAAFQANDLPSYYDVDGQINTIYLSQQTRVDRDYAVFTDMTFDITDKLKVSGGIRKFWVENTLFGFFGFNEAFFAGLSGETDCKPQPSAATIIPGLLPCINTNKKVVEDGETHRITLTYQIDPELMVYSTYSTGFRPGGNNRVLKVAPYGADTLTNIEEGWKTTWFDQRLRWNGAVFFERWKGVQLSVTGQFGITSIVNVGNAAVKGAETELSWLAIDNLTLSASGTYVNARTIDEFCDVNQKTEMITHSCAAPDAPTGTPLPVTPRLKVSGTARYTFQTGDYQNFVQGAVTHQSTSTSQLETVENNAMGNLPPFTTIDFSVGTGLHNWNLEAYIDNAFNKAGEVSRTDACANIYCYYNYHVYPIKPMIFGLKYGQKF